MDEKQLKELVDSIKSQLPEAVEGLLADAVKGLAKTEDLKDFIKSEDLEQLKTALEEQGVKMQQLLDEKQESKKETLVDVIEKHKEQIEKVLKGEVKSTEFEIKASTLTSSVTDNTQAYREQSIGQLATRKTVMYDMFRKVPLGSGSMRLYVYADWDEATTARAADYVAEGSTFPESTAKWIEKSVKVEKIGDTVPVSEEMLVDGPRFAAELQDFIRTNVALKVDTELYEGDGLAGHIKGLKNYVSVYAHAVGDPTVANGNIIDLIKIVAAKITNQKGSKYSPNFVLMNINDILRMQLSKDNNGNYIIPMFMTQNGTSVGNIQVIEYNGVDPNTFLLGDSAYAAIPEIEGITIEVGRNGDDFSSDLYTIKGRQRLTFVVREADLGGFLFVDDIDAALTAITV